MEATNEGVTESLLISCGSKDLASFPEGYGILHNETNQLKVKPSACSLPLEKPTLLPGHPYPPTDCTYTEIPFALDPPSKYDWGAQCREGHARS
jgi:hypothetical protein